MYCDVSHVYSMVKFQASRSYLRHIYKEHVIVESISSFAYVF